MRKTFIIIGMLLCGCGYNNFDLPEVPAHGTEAYNMDIADLCSLHGGQAYHIDKELIISGYVTANDKGGNFYRSFVLEDETGAVEIKSGEIELHNIYVYGRKVTVKAKGLTLGMYNGVAELGMRSYSPGSYQTDYIGYKTAVDKYIFRSDIISEISPTLKTISGLENVDCGKLIRLTGIELIKTDEIDNPTWAEAPVGWDNTPRTGYRMFTDTDGNEICIVTSGYAEFAGEEVPQGKINVTGILSYGKTGTGREMFLLKMRELKDVEID